MKAKEISLYEFLQLVIIRMVECKIDLPRNNRVWCNALRRLVEHHGRSPVTAINKLRFDWDGQDPSCPNFEETFQSFTTAGCIELQMPSGKYIPDPDVIELWRNEWLKDKPSDTIKQCIQILLESLEQEMSKRV